MKNMENAVLKVQALKGARSVAADVALDEEVLRHIVLKASEAKNPKGYAFMAGKNRAVDALRRRAAAPRIAARLAEKAMKEAEAEKLRKDDEEARQELSRIIIALRKDKGDSDKLACLFMSFVMLADDVELQAVWPKSSREARDQWRCRGKKMVRAAGASKNLCRYLKRHPVQIRQEAGL